ncbi:translation initiation factor IF-2 [Holospora curviuscula]|uniref:Translation initiation factor IF-2 n=1 Tax=Holospora curviuscula TaxID=1082868 RepID=A0A2S5R927_9PROT|nr:translation initiation factor IF-2 [Holospora curviuscula]PPE03828.1 Translation initiation factor IF-2 [Holospora curviuscula]
MTEEHKDKKRKPLKLNIEQVPPRPAEKESVRQTFVQGKTKRVTVEVRRGSRTSSERRSGGFTEKFTDEEQLRRLKAVQQAVREKEETELLRIAQEQAEAEQVARAALDHTTLNQEIPSFFVDSLETESTVSIQTDSIPLSNMKDSTNSTQQKTSEEKKRKFTNTRSMESGILGNKRSKPGSEEGNRGFLKRSKQKHEEISISPVLLEDEPLSGMEEAVSVSKKFPIRRNKIKKEKKIRSMVLRSIELTGPVVLQELAEKMAVKARQVVQVLATFNHDVTPNSVLDVETAELIIGEMGHQSIRVGLEDMEAELWKIKEGTLEERPPVVTIMGHVDHGKTSLLDALRKTSIASGEKGGITQHIGAYQTQLPSGKKITFIDTPGHEAFMRMRERGSAVTDIIVLVVAADDGVKEQTVEAIRHAKTANVPIIVAINKIDKAGVKPDVVRTELLNHGVAVEKMGGDVLDVEVSALTRKNLDGLINTILLQAEMMGLTCVPSARARGTVIESHMRKGHGHVATVLIQNGTLYKGDIFVTGTLSGKVRMMFNAEGKSVGYALPSQPVEVLGFSRSPISGEKFLALERESQAREFVEWKREHTPQSVEQSLKLPETSGELEAYFKFQNIKTLFLVIKTDVQGSVEGLTHEIEKIRHSEVALQIISSGVGPVNEGDAMLAKTSGAVILMFNTYVLPDAQKMIDQTEIRLLNHQIIYRAVEELKILLVNLLAPEVQEHFLGKAEVIKVFHVKKASSIAGCLVKEGMLRRGEMVKIFRDKTLLFEGEIKSLRHIKNDMKEVKFGYECGMILDGFDGFEVGDRVECSETRSVARGL